MTEERSWNAKETEMSKGISPMMASEKAAEMVDNIFLNDFGRRLTEDERTELVYEIYRIFNAASTKTAER
jgi:NMD protein affecting ribosome stability and mRNA decay